MPAAGHSLALFVFISIQCYLLRRFCISILADDVGHLCVKVYEFQYYFLKNLTLLVSRACSVCLLGIVKVCWSGCLNSSVVCDGAPQKRFLSKQFEFDVVGTGEDG